jgi:hypothetical protein
MPYVVKWKFKADDSPLESPRAYSSPAVAIDFACAILKEHPLEIWIDGSTCHLLRGVGYPVFA